MWWALALVTPTVLVLGTGIGQAAGQGAAPFSRGQFLLLWLAATLPPAFLVLGFRGRLPTPKSPSEEEFHRALKLVERAEGFVRQQLSAAAVAGSRPSAPARRAAPRVSGVLMLLAILLVGGGTWAFALTTAPPPEPVHLHVGLAVFHEDERLRFDDPLFDLASRRHLRSHLHSPDDGTLHLEGPPGHTLGDALAAAMDLHLGTATWQLDGMTRGGAVVNVRGGTAVWVRAPETSEWRLASMGVGHRLADGEQILVTSGALAENQLSKQQLAVPLPHAGAAQGNGSSSLLMASH